jgi:hypothetical protein
MPLNFSHKIFMAKVAHIKEKTMKNSKLAITLIASVVATALCAPAAFAIHGAIETDLIYYYNNDDDAVASTNNHDGAKNTRGN